MGVRICLGLFPHFDCEGTEGTYASLKLCENMPRQIRMKMAITPIIVGQFLIGNHHVSADSIPPRSHPYSCERTGTFNMQNTVYISFTVVCDIEDNCKEKH